MRKQTTIPPVSIRHGKLQPSTRFPNEEAKNKAMKTNWRLGIDRPLYESTMHASQTMVAALPPEVLALKPPRVLKNSSNKVTNARRTNVAPSVHQFMDHVAVCVAWFD